MGEPEEVPETLRELFEIRETRRNTQFKPKVLLEEMVSPGWRAAAGWQEDTFCKMHMIWPAFAKEQRLEAFYNSKAHVNRLKITLGEEAQWQLFNKIMLLKDDVTVRRALLWDPAQWKPYTPESWEKDYLELPGFVGKFVDCYKESNVPAPFFAWAAISLLGICCKYNVYVQVGGEELLHNLFTFFVGDAAAGKSYAKTCVQTIITRLNEKLNTVLPASENPEGVPYDRTIDRPDLWVNILSQDGTYESAIERLAEIRKTPLMKVIKDQNGNPVPQVTGYYADAAAVLIVDEVSEHFGAGDWAANKKVAGYTAMYTGKERSKSTVGRGQQAYDHQAYSMIVCGAVEWFKGSVTPAMMHGGFMDRSLFVYRTGTHRIYTAFDMPVVDPIMEEELAADLIPLVCPPNQMRRRIQISPGAQKLLTEISTKEFQYEIDVRDLKTAKSENYKSSAVRREHMKIKIASLLTIGASPQVSGDLEIKPIGVEEIILAEKLIVHEDANFTRFLDAVNLTDATEFCQWLHGQFLRNEWRPIEARTLLTRAWKKAAFNIKSMEDLHKRLALLVDAKVITRTMVQSKRKSKHKPTAPGSVGWASQDSMELWSPYI